ncbi:hypothetical protein BH09PSE6_BH09PSE6_02750 [soil metagenome]
MRIFATVSLAALLLVSPLSHAAPVKVGMAISVDGDGFFLNPVVRKITISEVEKASLAEAAGIVVGDELVAVEGRAVAGQRANDLRSLAKFNPGEPRRLRLRHADGEEYDAVITKPAEN